jgi:hypothetical protein
MVYRNTTDRCVVSFEAVFSARGERTALLSPLSRPTVRARRTTAQEKRSLSLLKMKKTGIQEN